VELILGAPLPGLTHKHKDKLVKLARDKTLELIAAIKSFITLDPEISIRAENL